MYFDALHKRPFDAENLTRIVTKVDIEWMEGWGNHPSPVLHITENLSDIFTAPLYEQHDRLFVADHPLGFVKYLSHSGKPGPAHNEGGFGGGRFDIDVKGKGQLALYGPWSSRAACVNMFMPPEQQIVDIVVHEPRWRTGTACAIKLEALKHIWPSHLYLVRGRTMKREQGPIVPSTAPDCVRKPSGFECDGYGSYECLTTTPTPAPAPSAAG